MTYYTQDTFHAQRRGGNLTEFLKTNVDYVGELILCPGPAVCCVQSVWLCGIYMYVADL